MLNNEKHGQGTHSTKMGHDSLVGNTSNAQECTCPTVLDFNEERLHWASVVCVYVHILKHYIAPSKIILLNCV